MIDWNEAIYALWLKRIPGTLQTSESPFGTIVLPRTHPQCFGGSAARLAPCVRCDVCPADLQVKRTVLEFCGLCQFGATVAAKVFRVAVTETSDQGQIVMAQEAYK
jgi:hypothetical protein